MQFKRVVVTGIGAITPIGDSAAEFFKSLDEGKSGAAPITRFDASLFQTRFACEVKDFDFQKFGFTRKEANKYDLYTQFALVAAQEAVKDSGLDTDQSIDKNRVGVLVSSGVGGLETFSKEVADYTEGEPPRYSPFLIPRIITDMAAGHISIKYGFRGPNFGVTAACATSSESMCVGAQMIQTSRADVVLVGGAEAPIATAGVGSFNSMRALSTRNEDCAGASRPFDKDRDGFVIAEGAGVLVLEEYEHAVRRGAKIYAELTGIGMSADAYHFTAPDPQGTGAMLAMQNALDDAGVSAADVDYINAHGTSTHLGDIAEVLAIKQVFGEAARKLNISSTKSMTGHMLGAAGAVEAIACIHAIRDGIIPPTINFETEDEEIDYSLNYTFNKPQRREVNVALSNSFGFGGHNSCVVLQKLK